MNKVTLKSRATLLGKVFAAKGVILTRAEQLTLVAQLEGARDWHHANAEMANEVRREAPVLFNELQLEAAQAYCMGDFAHMTNYEELSHVGDTLFEFAIREISDAEGNRDEAVRMMRQAADELITVADHLEGNSAQHQADEFKVMKPTLPYRHEATNVEGNSAGWNLRFITERSREPLENLSETAPDLAKWIQENDEALQRLANTCLDEMAFVVEMNGQKGVLYEVEIETTESEGTETDGTPWCLVSEADRRIQLQRDIADLEKKHPNLQWAIGGPDGVWNGRLAVWAFSPEPSLFSPEEAKTLMLALYDKFY